MKIGELSLLGASFALGCATSTPGVEPSMTGLDADSSPAVESIETPAEHRPPIGNSPLVGNSIPADNSTSAANTRPVEHRGPIDHLPPIDRPPPIAIPKIRLPVFGAITTDAEGRLSILASNEIHNAENAMYGWLIWVGPTSEAVQWTETLDAPVAAKTKGDSDLAPTGERRRSTFANAMVPVQGFVFSQWALGGDEVPGRYEIEVALPEGRTESFSFTLGHPQDACPAMRILLNWWGAKHSLEGDPANRDVSDRVLNVFGTRLARHGFVAADLDDAYWYVMASAARRSDDRTIAYGHIVMRAIADFQGKARRYSSTTNFTGRIDYGVLFDSPVSRLDEFIRTLADQFAAVLSPHARQSCSDWWTGQREEEARLEDVRIQLEEEIRRVRERRAEREKRLELDVDPRGGDGD